MTGCLAKASGASSRVPFEDPTHRWNGTVVNDTAQQGGVWLLCVLYATYLLVHRIRRGEPRAKSFGLWLRDLSTWPWGWGS
jgi:hypothetical protein